MGGLSEASDTSETYENCCRSPQHRASYRGYKAVSYGTGSIKYCKLERTTTGNKDCVSV